MSVWDILTTYYPAFLTGLYVTLKLCTIIWAGGLVLGSALALAGIKFPKAVGLPSRGFSFFLGGRTPYRFPVLVALPRPSDV